MTPSLAGIAHGMMEHKTRKTTSKKTTIQRPGYDPSVAGFAISNLQVHKTRWKDDAFSRRDRSPQDYKYRGTFCFAKMVPLLDQVMVFLTH